MKKFIVYCLVISHCFAANYNSNQQQADDFLTKGETKVPLSDKPEDVQVPNDLKIKKFFLNTPTEQIKEVQQKSIEQQKTFDGFDDSVVNKKPEIRPLSSMDEIFVHPYFTTTVLLPVGSVISYAESSLPTNVFRYDENAIIFQPQKNAVIGNITVFYTLDGKNKNLNLIIKLYGKEILAGNKINITYSYRDVKKLDPLDVINIYVKEYGKLPDKPYNYVYIDDIVYRIVKDDVNGKIMFNGNKYRVGIGVMYK